MINGAPERGAHRRRRRRLPSRARCGGALHLSCWRRRRRRDHRRRRSGPQTIADRRDVARFPFTLPEGQQFTNTGRQLVSIAPDGSQFVYVANNRLYLKPMRELSSIFIQGTEITEGVLNPVFSPDSRSLVFYSGADKTLKRIAVSGGAPVTIGPG